MTPEKTLFSPKSMGKARSIADQRKDAVKSSVSRSPQVIRDGNADSTAFIPRENNPEKRRITIH